jgi:hypothetical protein
MGGHRLGCAVLLRVPPKVRRFPPARNTSKPRKRRAAQNAPWPLDSWLMIQHRGPRRWVYSAETKDLMSRRERTALDVLVAARLQGAAGAMNGSHLSQARIGDHEELTLNCARPSLICSLTSVYCWSMPAASVCSCLIKPLASATIPAAGPPRPAGWLERRPTRSMPPRRAQAPRCRIRDLDVRFMAQEELICLAEVLKPSA